MTIPRDTGGAAFPLKEPATFDFEGMTLRDYFAAKAMQGLIAQSCGAAWAATKEHYALYAYEMADEMLKAREL